MTLSLRWMLLLAIITLGPALLAGCNDGDDSNGHDLKIGVLLPASGDLASMGRDASVVLDQAVADLTRRLAQLGDKRTVRVKTLDTASDPDTAAAQAEVLAKEGYRLIIGPLGSATCEAVLPVAAARGLLLLSPTSTSQALAIAGDPLYRLILSDENQGKALAVYLRERGARAVVPVYRDDLYGQGLAEDLAREFAALGGQVATPVSYDPSGFDSASLAGQVAGAVESAAAEVEGGAGAVAVALMAYDESAAILAACADVPLLSQAIWTGSDGTARNASILDNPDAASFARTVGFTGLTFSRDPEAQPRPGLVLADMVLREDIRSREPGKAESQTLGVWDAVWLGGLALVQAGPGATLAELASAVESVARAHVGLNGMLRFNDAGDLRYGDYGFYTVRPGGGWAISAAYHFDGEGQSFAFVSPAVNPGTNPPVAEYFIGGLLPLTGAAREAGQAARAGLENAVAAINQHLELNGYPVRLGLDLMDTASDATTARSGLEALADRGVHQVIGPATSAAVEAALPQAATLDSLLLSPSSTAVSLAVPDDNLYRFVPSDAHQSAALARFMWEQGVRVFAVAYRDDAWGRELAEGVSEAFADLGGTSVEGIAYDPSDLNVGAVLEALDAQVAGAVQAEGSAATAVLLLGFDEGVDLLAGAGEHAALASVRWLGADGLARSERLATDAAAAAFAANHEFTASIYSLTVGNEVVPNSWPRQAIFDRIAAQLGAEPSAFAYSAWDALWVLTYDILDHDWQTEASVLGPGLITTAPSCIGLTNYMRLDDNGDKTFGDYGFFRLVPAGGGHAWSLFATYHFHPGYLPPVITYP